MGGLGSGRRPTRASVADCRVLEIGELCDAKRCARHPRGEIRWLSRGTGRTRARLSYAIRDELRPDGAPLLILAAGYQMTLTAPESCERIVLSGGAGVRFLAACPRCGGAVRKLYAPPGAEHFFCRECYGLVYRRGPHAKALANVQAAVGPLLKGLYELSPEPASARSAAAKRSALQALQETLEAELPLGAQELRIYCLHLRKASLSLRQIAALVDCSKSSVGRYCAAGLHGVDMQALITERLERLWAFPTAPLGDDPKALREYLMMIGRHVRRLRFKWAPGTEPEERVLIIADADDEGGTTSEESI
jgi:hypothetical protein